MLNQQTIDQLLRMKLKGMSYAYQEQLQQPAQDLSFEERFGLIVDREWTYREDHQLKHRLKAAKLRQPACVEDIDYRHPRGWIVRSLKVSLPVSGSPNLKTSSSSDPPGPVKPTWLALWPTKPAVWDS